MNNKIITISIAAYNVESYIEKALDSLILPENYMNKLDIIVVDDGSKDNTASIVKKYSDKFPDSIRLASKENGGYGSTINTSLYIARGKYYKLLDGDDWYNTSALCDFIDYLEKADSDIVVTPYYEVITSENKIDRHPELSGNTVNIQSAAMADTLVMHELAVQTELLKKKNTKISEKCFYTDAEFVFECLTAAQTVSRFDKAVYCYRLGLEGQSVSVTGIRKHYKDMLTVSKRIYELYTDTPPASGHKKTLMEHAVENITYHTYQAYMLLENPVKSKPELIAWDRMIKQSYPKIYEISMRSKTIKLLRNLNFMGYGVLCRTVLNRLTK